MHDVALPLDFGAWYPVHQDRHRRDTILGITDRFQTPYWPPLGVRGSRTKSRLESGRPYADPCPGPEYPDPPSARGRRDNTAAIATVELRRACFAEPWVTMSPLCVYL